MFILPVLKLTTMRNLDLTYLKLDGGGTIPIGDLQLDLQVSIPANVSGIYIATVHAGLRLLSGSTDRVTPKSLSVMIQDSTSKKYVLGNMWTNTPRILLEPFLVDSSTTVFIRLLMDNSVTTVTTYDYSIVLGYARELQPPIMDPSSIR